MQILYFLFIGALAGWLAGLIMRGGGFGLLVNIIVGVAGAFVGKFLSGVIGLHAYGLLGAIVMATAGAVVLLFVLGLLRKA